MIKNYFRIALRKLKKHKLYTLINIIGLTTGITCFILIGLFVTNELGYDRFHKNADRIVRVTMEYGDAGSSVKTEVTGTKAGPQFARSFPEVAAFTRVIDNPDVVRNGNRIFDEQKILYADSSFLRIFSFPLLAGDPNTALDAPGKLVLTPAMARKYFGGEDPMGKTLRIGTGGREYQVTGVIKEAPANSQIKFNFLVSFTSLAVSKEEHWTEANYITYLLLRHKGQESALQKKISSYMKAIGQSEEQSEGSEYLTFHLEPLTKVHLYSALGGLEPNVSVRTVYILAMNALLILLIACINYTNLATAQSAGRGTEIGIRKVLGAGKGQLFGQFIGESVLLTWIALLLSVALTMMVLPAFNALTGKAFTAGMLARPAFIAALALLGLIVGFLSGSYPALILSNTRLTNILKSGLRLSSGGGGFRKTLIVFQFAISVFLIISTIIILQQLSYIRHKDLGYTREHVLMLPVDSKMRAHYDDLKQAILLSPKVVQVSGGYESPTFVQWGDGIRAANGKHLNITAIPADLGYIGTLGMHLVAGTDFTPADLKLLDTADNYKNYRYTFILNETAVKDLGWTPQEAIGKTLYKGAYGTVKAVVKDFHFSSLHQPIGPLVIFLNKDFTREMFVRISGSDIPATLRFLERVWKERVTGRPFEYHFLDEEYNRLYTTEQEAANVFTVFSMLAILLACLGLLGLAAYTTVQRTKEIGIRKVLGAGSFRIAWLLSVNFVWLVLIGILLVIPVAWYAAHRWLRGFAYRVSVEWWVFALAGSIAIAIAWATVSLQALKAASANPVRSLRTE